jgi:CubicO group peptidase (beta-lactamase class C family)
MLRESASKLISGDKVKKMNTQTRLSCLARRALVGCVLSSIVFAGCTTAHLSTKDTVAPERDARAVLDVPALEALSGDIRSGKYPNIHGLVLLRGGKFAWEDYFEGSDERRGEPLGVVRFDADTLHDARSVTKSVVAALFGVALAKGRIKDLDAPILDYFPEYSDLATPQRRTITLEHLLSMTSGIRWDESSHPYGDPRNSESAMDRAVDPYRYVLEQPIATRPGTTWNYSGGDTMILSRVIERATGEDLEVLAKRALFAPLAIDKYEWLRYPGGAAIAASGLRLLPRDMAKIGQLYLNDGNWSGAQLFATSWARDSLFAQATIAERPFGFQRYGYQWWQGTARVRERSVPFAAAVGWGGQRIFVVPTMDVVVVVTAGLYGDPRQMDVTFEVVLERILPAVADCPLRCSRGTGHGRSM